MSAERTVSYNCPCCGQDMTRVVVERLAGPPPASPIIAQCMKGTYARYFEATR